MKKRTLLNAGVVAIGLACVILSGCAGPQSALGGAPPSRTENSVAARQASSSDLLYVVTSDAVIDILSYPGYKYLGTLQSAKGTTAPITSNPTNGDILINRSEGICEYAHGGQQPIAEIHPQPSYGTAADYAFDPTTQNIAVSFQLPTNKPGAVGIYQTPSSNPTLYSVPNMKNPGFLGYDDQGNLFVDGRGSLKNSPGTFAELPKGGSAFTNIALNKTLTDMTTIQWDGSYITIANGATIYEIQISGSSGTIVGQTVLDDAWPTYPLYWIQGGTVIGPHTSRHKNRFLGFWDYPQGGRPFKVITSLSKRITDRMVGEAVSVGSSL